MIRWEYLNTTSVFLSILWVSEQEFKNYQRILTFFDEGVRLILDI